MCKLPRWGLKRELAEGKETKARCKFTPLGFETFVYSAKNINNAGVNLPRWGLKQCVKSLGYYPV